VHGNSKGDVRYQLFEEMDSEGSSLVDHRIKERVKLSEIIKSHRLSAIVGTASAGKTKIVGDLIEEDPSIGFADARGERGRPGQSAESILRHWGFSGQKIFVLDEFRIENNRDMLEYLFEHGVQHVIVIEGGNRANRLKKKDFTDKLGIEPQAILELGVKPLNKQQIREAFQISLDGGRDIPFSIKSDHMDNAKANLENLIKATKNAPFIPAIIDEMFQQITRQSKSGVLAVQDWEHRIVDALSWEFTGLIVPAGDIDAAQLATPGGIDLNPTNLSLNGYRSGEDISFKLDQAMLKQLQNSPGFTPVIINIQPMTDLRLFLGLKAEKVAPAAV
jgi:hypothetical protein